MLRRVVVLKGGGGALKKKKKEGRGFLFEGARRRRAFLPNRTALLLFSTSSLLGTAPPPTRAETQSRRFLVILPSLVNPSWSADSRRTNHSFSHTSLSSRAAASTDDKRRTPSPPSSFDARADFHRLIRVLRQRVILSFSPRAREAGREKERGRHTSPPISRRPAVVSPNPPTGRLSRSLKNKP